MHGVLEGHSSPLKFWVPPKVTNSLSTSLFKLALNFQVPPKMEGGGWHHEMYVFYTIDNIHWFCHNFCETVPTLTIVIHFLQIWMQIWAMSANICTIILSYLVENQKPFLAQWFKLISIEKEEQIFSVIYLTTYIFQYRSGHKCWEPEILNTLWLIYF